MILKNTTKPLLLETIKIDKGVIHNLPYHQERCNISRKKLYAAKDILRLEEYISPPPQGCYRCRIIYAQTIKSIEYIPYKPKEIQTFKIVPSTLEYTFKYANRDIFDALLQIHSDVDDIIIQKEGYITDTSIANLAFFDGKKWYTPSRPLLKGTMRQKLLNEGFLHTKPIQKEDLNHYSHVALMNAMLGFKIVKDFKILV